MKFYFAPMEGVTGYIFRKTHAEHFPGTDKYYTPFIVANQTLHMKTREKKDIAPENNEGVPVVPQVLANKAEECMAFLRILADLGYREVNLRGLRLVRDGGYLATCSCSHFMTPELFTKTIREAARGAHKRLRQVEYREQAADHPILWAGEENSYYLKFYIFQVV